MKTLILYRPNSDHERTVIDYLRDFKMQTGKDVPTVDADSVEGAQLSELYGILQYPAVLVTDDEGHVQTLWAGGSMPRIGELSYYVTDTGLTARKHTKIIKAPNDRN